MEFDYDYAVVGSGICGLFTAALLAKQGAKVCIVEQHYKVGGYAHSFYEKKYWFCAGLHYVFNSLDDEDGGLFFEKMGMQNDVRFEPMADDKFDVVRFPTITYEVKRGSQRNIDSLSQHFPQSRNALKKYYEIIGKIYEEAFSISVDLPLKSFLLTPWKFSSLLKYRGLTTQALYDDLGLPKALQDVLSGQCGNIGVPPSKSSLIAHAINVMAYDQGAAYPEKSYFHMIQTIERFIKGQKGCKIYLGERVEEVLLSGASVVGLKTSKREITAKEYLFNADPKLLVTLLPGYKVPRWLARRLKYDYSPPSFTIFMGLKNIDLAGYGFGNWNTWHYPTHDMNAIYQRQVDQHDVSNPFWAITTPTMHGKAKKVIAPPDGHQMVLCTWAGYEKIKRLRNSDIDQYYKEKSKVTEAALRMLETHYIPGIRNHIDVIQTGSPTTNEFFCASPEGNSYGASMTPAHVNLGKIDRKTPFKNLHFLNASSGMPGLGGAFRTALSMFAHLSGDDDVLRRLNRK
ncbi:MAG: NAD(P)/FAD-dependent oxidoreductase, partial [Proteobacteria bacterium]|nr:NAD(P)/FAD-dependent oxidoreductase [Pseudomonadota bacterium]